MAPERVEGPDQQGQPPNESDPSRFFPVIFGAGVALVLLVQALEGPLGTLGVGKIWLYVAAGVIFVGLIALVIFVARFRNWLKQAGMPKKTAFLTFFVGPILVTFVLVMSWLPAPRQIVALRIGFIAVVCLFPSALYYLFIATRKGSLLNEFVANMARLGLLGRTVTVAPDMDWGPESETDRHRRVEAYLQRFEAMYGPIPENALKEVLPENDWTWVSRRAGRAAAFGVGGVFVSEAAVPVLFATFLTALMWITVLPLPLPIVRDLLPVSLVKAVPWLHAFHPNVTAVTAAFLGAYFFSLQMLFRRYVRRDLRPSAYVGLVLRILLAVIGIWIIDKTMFPTSAHANPALGEIPAGMSREEALAVLGFVIGMFPRIAWQLIAGIAKRLTPEIFLPSLRSELPISDLDGLTVWHEARLEEEDIENIPNMATADILELMLNTRFPADRIIDWVDQAILYTYLGVEGASAAPSPQPAGESPLPSRRHLLRAHGIRTATTLTDMYRTARVRQDNDQFLRILPGQGRSPMLSLVDAVETNPNVRLIRMWRGLQPVQVAT
jgi:hypothetical protein